MFANSLITFAFQVGIVIVGKSKRVYSYYSLFPSSGSTFKIYVCHRFSIIASRAQSNKASRRPSRVLPIIRSKDRPRERHSLVPGMLGLIHLNQNGDATFTPDKDISRTQQRRRIHRRRSSLISDEEIRHGKPGRFLLSSTDSDLSRCISIECW